MKSAALVTGCAGGIGSAIVKKFIDSGFYVVGLDVREPDILPNCFIRCDLRKVTRSASGLARLRSELRGILKKSNLKVLVNNAAIQILAEFEKLTLDQFHESLDVNVVAPFVLSQLCIDSLKSSGGMIVNIGSIHSRLTKPGFVAYATSKGALESLTRALAVELGHEVRVNAIMPAAIETAMLVDGFDGDRSLLSSLKSHHPVRRLGTPEEIADLIEGLISMKLPFLNGSVIDLSGGIASRLHDPVDASKK